MIKVINIIPVSFPVELVYADKEPGEFFTRPVIGYAAIEDTEDGETDICPVVMKKNGINVVMEFEDNILGISEKPFNPEDWEDESRIYHEGE